MATTFFTVQVILETVSADDTEGVHVKVYISLGVAVPVVVITILRVVNTKDQYNWY